MTFESINPTTGETIKGYAEMSPGETLVIIEKTHDAFQQWRKTAFGERAELMKAAAQILRDRSNEYAILMAEEMGKPIRQGRAEAEKCAWVCDYYAENAETFLQPEIVATDASKSFVTFQPLGIVMAIMPWNFPFWQVLRFAAPALMAGNAGLLKHAPNVPASALAIEDLFREARFPENLFRTILVDVPQVATILEDSRVKAATLTGSTRAGSAVAKKAGELIKKTVLELGGSDPYVVLEDADLHRAVDTCVASRLINSGQSCIAAKRFIVAESLRDEFEQRYVERMRESKMGDPLEEDTELGPQARQDLRDDLHRQVEESIENGARCLLGGEIPEGEGFFYPPTLLTDVKSGMPAYDEELFGPVASVIPVPDETEAIRVANDSPFGLGAAVFTQDVKRGEEIATNELDAGCCFVNDFVRSDPRLPFGGVNESGYGRELSHYGMKEFTNIKTVFVR